jgi:phage antirepressor YoqD-like protein
MATMKVYGLRQAAKEIGVKYHQLLGLCRKGEIKYMVIGKSYVIDDQELRKAEKLINRSGYISHSQIARKYGINRTTVIAILQRSNIQPDINTNGALYRTEKIDDFARANGWIT